MATDNRNPGLWIRIIYNSLAIIPDFLPIIEPYILRLYPKHLIPALSSFSYNCKYYL